MFLRPAIRPTAASTPVSSSASATTLVTIAPVPVPSFLMAGVHRSFAWGHHGEYFLDHDFAHRRVHRQHNAECSHLCGAAQRSASAYCQLWRDQPGHDYGNQRRQRDAHRPDHSGQRQRFAKACLVACGWGCFACVAFVHEYAEPVAALARCFGSLVLLISLAEGVLACSMAGAGIVPGQGRQALVSLVRASVSMW